MENKLHIKTVDFHAAHYLPEKYGKCHQLHGHTYTFEDIEIVTEGIVDFSDIKHALEAADHCLLIPEKDVTLWHNIRELIPCQLAMFPINDEETTVEAIARYLEEGLLQVEGVKSVKFTLYETKTSGARRPCK